MYRGYWEHGLRNGVGIECYGERVLYNSFSENHTQKNAIFKEICVDLQVKSKFKNCEWLLI